MQLLKKIGFGVVLTYLGLMLLSQVVSGCFSFQMSDKDLQKAFRGKRYQPVQHDIDVSDRTIHYASVGNDSLPTVLFVHGSPGSWSAFVDFFKDDSLLAAVQMVSVDRPGFGESGLGEAEKSLERQAAYLKPIVARYKKPGRKLILIGHSLGGPLVARMTMDYPALIDGLVMVAPSIAPALEPNEWYRPPGDWPVVRYLLPNWLRASNREIIYLKPELERMLPLWSNIAQPCIVIQGGKDVLVHPGNADFASKHLVRAKPLEVVFVPDMNHFVPWSHPHLIRRAILRILQHPTAPIGEYSPNKRRP